MSLFTSVHKGFDVNEFLKYCVQLFFLTYFPWKPTHLTSVFSNNDPACGGGSIGDQNNTFVPLLWMLFCWSSSLSNCICVLHWGFFIIDNNKYIKRDNWVVPTYIHIIEKKNCHNLLTRVHCKFVHKFDKMLDWNILYCSSKMLDCRLLIYLFLFWNDLCMGNEQLKIYFVLENFLYYKIWFQNLVSCKNKNKFKKKNKEI